MPATIELQNVSVDRQAVINGQTTPVRIVTGVHVTIPAKGRLVILGPSGAGKTSLLRLFNRLDDPVEGEVLLDGTDIRRLDPVTVRRRVGMVFQQPFLFDMTVAENLAYPRKLMGQELAAADAERLLAEFGLPADFLVRNAQQLSGGQQQRIAVARALTLHPDVLLLDEPSSALDEESARLLVDALVRRNDVDGMSIIMVSHSPEIMKRVGGQALLVHDRRASLFAEVEAALHDARHGEVPVE